jgi:hypothetical protein
MGLKISEFVSIIEGILISSDLKLQQIKGINENIVLHIEKRSGNIQTINIPLKEIANRNVFGSSI